MRRMAGGLAACLVMTLGQGAGTVPDTAVRPAFYRVERQEGVWWLVAPDGKRFFSLGVNVIDRGAEREKYRSDKPEYAAFRHYKDDAAWARATLTRLRAWKFNTLGGWCDLDALRKAPDLMLPYTVGLWMGSEAGVPWLDLFSEETTRKFDEVARREVAPRKDDPHLIGYFTDNELGWWDETIFHYHLQHPTKNTTPVLIRLLRKHYGDDFSRLRRDFETDARRFEDLEKPAPLTLKPGGRGREVIDKFTFVLAQRYYRMAHDAIRRYDKNHLILGDRYIAWYPPAVARAIRPYVDVVSTNYNADWTDGSNARFHFERLYRLTGKPILVTEFYMAAMENRSGNKNSSAGFATVKTQRERAAGFKKNLSAYAGLPYVVGAHWFQYYDEPTFGRGDGEDFNMGLVDIEDRPYEELTRVAATLRVEEIHRRAAAPPARTEYGLPPAPAKPLEGLRRWDKGRAFIAGATQTPAADLYACWDSQHLYLAVHAADYADKNLYRNGVVPKSEQSEWVIRVEDSRKTIRVRFGPGEKATVEGAPVELRTWSGSTRVTAMVALPASLFGKREMRGGDRLSFRTSLVLHSRAARMDWQVRHTLGSPSHVTP